MSDSNTPGHTDAGTQAKNAAGQAAGAKDVSHAKGGGEASIVPQKLQEKLPESVERAVPNALHDTGDKDGLDRK